MPEKHPPPIQLRRLSSELVRLRAAAGMTQEQVQYATHISRGALSRVENAGGRPHFRTLETLLDLYGASEVERAELLELHRAANNDRGGWLSRYRDILPGEYSSLIQYEGMAKIMSNYEGQAIPGLLQTAEYAAANSAATTPTLSEEARSKRVEARMRRQQALRQEKPLQFWAIIDEAALRRPVGGWPVMRVQLAKLAEDSHLANVTLQVIPFEVGAHAGTLGSFVVLDFPEPDPPVVYLEHMGGNVILEDQGDVKQFKTTFRGLSGTALSPDESLRMIADIARS